MFLHSAARDYEKVINRDIFKTVKSWNRKKLIIELSFIANFINSNLKNTFVHINLSLMSVLLDTYERILLEKLKNDDQSAFTIIFTKYYEDLVRFSFAYTKDTAASEGIVQEVFLKLWENRISLVIHSSLKSFLLKSVQNRSIDSLRHVNIAHKYASIVLAHPILAENDTENYILHSELEANFKHAMAKIPFEYAEAFRMSRIETLNYLDIAQKLGISVRTVEVRIGKALNLLRNELKDYLVLIFLIYSFIY